MNNCSVVPDCEAYIYTTWAIGPILLIVIVILITICAVLYTRLKKTKQVPKLTNRNWSGTDIQLENGSTDRKSNPPSGVNLLSATLPDVNYETVVDLEAQTSPHSAHAHMPVDDSGQNYEYIAHQVNNVVPSNGTAAAGSANSQMNEEPLPYEDFIHAGGQSSTIAQQQASKIAVESSNERYSRLIHFPEVPNPGPSVRHSSHLLSTSTNEQEYHQYGTLEGNISPPPLPPPLIDVENDSSIIELKFNTDHETDNTRESYYCNISRQSVTLEAAEEQDGEDEVFYCNTAPEVERLEPSLSLEEIGGGEVLYEEAMPLNLQTEELYMNVKRS